MKRCCGLTRDLRRCGRSGSWRLFCADHRLQWIGWASFLLFTAGAGSLQIISFIRAPVERVVVVPAPIENVIVIPSPIANSGRKPDLRLQSPQVSYRAEQEPDNGVYDTLFATIDRQVYRVISGEDGMCFHIADQRDFDGNGSIDVLLNIQPACGGNIVLDNLAFVSYLGDGHFQRSQEFGAIGQSPIVEAWKGAHSVVIYNPINYAPFNFGPPGEIRERYLLADGKAVLVERSERRGLVAVAEMRSSVFAKGDDDRIVALKFDLNDDGQIDALAFKFRARSGSMSWWVNFANGSQGYGPSTWCKRVGILESRSNGMRDVVCDLDDLYQWDGTRYTRCFDRIRIATGDADTSRTKLVPVRCSPAPTAVR